MLVRATDNRYQIIRIIVHRGEPLHIALHCLLNKYLRPPWPTSPPGARMPHRPGRKVPRWSAAFRTDTVRDVTCQEENQAISAGP
ncbi:hypothetical protein SCLCIDRAFT_1118155 [Scleroderma citrinum Foug A]|uniref:Uncharacterized protein n=1 Tax=Scleroderma citrinum Foug A TaxID=1036808 RepID=A0A0C2ZZG6_9AGAM|nr:hypothetical protein SCLCIDRAFT_1118155 [Scleroderma citrinum Foug A]